MSHVHVHMNMNMSMHVHAHPIHAHIHGFTYMTYMTYMCRVWSVRGACVSAPHRTHKTAHNIITIRIRHTKDKKRPHIPKVAPKHAGMFTWYV